MPVCECYQATVADAERTRPRQRATQSNTGKGSVSRHTSITNPGLVVQMTGFLTKKRYKYATLYIDQATGLGFTYLHKTDTAEETLAGKRAFERYATSRGVQIQAYHADNEIFKSRAWVDACDKQNQELTFAAVGAHHTNGKAERRIRELQELARTTLNHAYK